MILQAKRGLSVLLLGAAMLGANPLTLPTAEAGGLGKALLGRVLRGSASNQATKAARPTMAEVLRRDAARDAATPARPLAAPRTVHRYTSVEQARREAKSGLNPDTHMTPNAQAGRPLTGNHAQRRYGTPSTPGARSTIVLPKGFPVRQNKALGGEPGRGELTSPHPVPPEAIRGYTELPR